MDAQGYVRVSTLLEILHEQITPVNVYVRRFVSTLLETLPRLGPGRPLGGHVLAVSTLLETLPFVRLVVVGF